jgi:protein ImuB
MSAPGTDDLFTGLWARARRSLACVDLPAFGLQLLLVSRPEWRDLPAVVIDEDRPQGLLLEANRQARERGVHPGQRYAHALGLCRELRAAVVPPHTLGAGLGHVVSLLRTFSPHLEPSRDEPGVIWLDTSGLTSLYGTLFDWALAVTDRLEQEGFTSFIAVGFSRFGTYAAVKAMHGGARGMSGEVPLARRIRAITTPEAERDLAAQVPLDYLALTPSLRERLAQLSIRTLGELSALPRAGLLRRFGVDVADLVALQSGERDAPLTPVVEARRLTARRLLDYVEHDATRLIVHIEGLLDELWPELVRRERRVVQLDLVLGREGRRSRGEGSVSDTHLEHHDLRPAVPTRERALLLDLVRLRLEGLTQAAESRAHPALDTRGRRARDRAPEVSRADQAGASPGGFVLVAIELHDAPGEVEQGNVLGPTEMDLVGLGQHSSGADPAAAARALARVVAELGDGRVTLITPREGHLPRTRQVLSPLSPGALKRPSPTPLDADPPLIRRLHRSPEPMPPRPRDLRNDGWPARLMEQGPLIEVSGPWVVSGGWWAGSAGGLRQDVHREYAYAETRRGDLIWIYYDRRRRRWLEEGGVG